MLIKKLFLVLLLSLIVFIFSSSLYAHEFAKPCYWSISEGDYYITRVNDFILSNNSIYDNNILDAINSWEVSATRASCVYEPNFTYSNVDLATSTSIWEFYECPPSALALTVLGDSVGYMFANYYDSMNSTGQLIYSTIYFNPNNSSQGLNETGQKWVIVHEIGHVYGLWHCLQSTVSIMKPGLYNGFSPYLRTHDINDMNSKYGLPE